MSFSTLNIGATALTAAQRGVDNAAHNISASTVPGYTRQRLELATLPATPGTAGMRGSGMRGNGVTVVQVQRLRSTLNDLAVRNESATAGSTGARAAVLDRAQGVLGPYGNGLPESLTKLWDAFSALGHAPAEPAARATVLDAANEVATGLNDAATELAQVRSDTTAQIGDGVTETNSLTKQVAGLNTQIADALMAGQSPNDLLDTRDVALDRLAELTGATSTRRDNGMVDVTIGGQAVVTLDKSVDLTVGAVPPPAGSTGDDPVVQLGGTTITVGGSVGGGVSAAAGDLRDVQQRLDALAGTIASTVNTQHAKGYDLQGNPGGAVFTGSSAATLSLDPALTEDTLAASGSPVAGGNPLDGEAATALGAGLRKPGADGTSLNSRAVGLAGTLGSRAADAARSADAAATSLSGLTDARAASDGVSIDEEMIDLVKYQHSYEAAGRVISIADSMLNTLINGMGAGR